MDGAWTKLGEGELAVKRLERHAWRYASGKRAERKACEKKL